ncbi:hypothetical protein VP1G_10504 [Cytospora mali]|uniref:Uncharacterized protein n=1 Tax=Cytospora mali TaxID=578113 RepID=A0A194ULS9_CYTMA|nr:hypothetical protein VP1G_10504 [Valsa mali var. pyri (nom. inval.)]
MRQRDQGTGPHLRQEVVIELRHPDGKADEPPADGIQRFLVGDGLLDGADVAEHAVVDAQRDLVLELVVTHDVGAAPVVVEHPCQVGALLGREHLVRVHARHAVDEARDLVVAPEPEDRQRRQAHVVRVLLAQVAHRLPLLAERHGQFLLVQGDGRDGLSAVVLLCLHAEELLRQVDHVVVHEAELPDAPLLGLRDVEDLRGRSGAGLWAHISEPASTEAVDGFGENAGSLWPDDESARVTRRLMPAPAASSARWWECWALPREDDDDDALAFVG